MNITTLLLLLLLAALALIAIAAKTVAARKPQRKATGNLWAKRPLTDREQAMYFRLTSTFPEHVVLAQVSFSALLDSKDRPTRSTFDRKVADFVLCLKDFTPVAVIELDDKTHRGREASDAARDSTLTKAGYRVLRFSNLPNMTDLKAALSPKQPT